MLPLLVTSLVIVLLGPLPQEATSLQHSILEDGDANESIQNDVRSNYEVKSGTGINHNIKDLLPDERKKKSKQHKIKHKKVNKDRKDSFSKKSKKEKSRKIQKKEKKIKKSSEIDNSFKKNKKKQTKKSKFKTKQYGGKKKRNKNVNKQKSAKSSKMHKDRKGKNKSDEKQSLKKIQKKKNRKIKVKNNRGKVKEKKIKEKRLFTLGKSEPSKDSRKSKAGGINILDQNGKTREISRQGGCGSSINLEAGESIIIFSNKDKMKIKCKTPIKSPSGTTLSVSCPLFNLYESKKCKVESFKLKSLSGYKGKLCGSKIVSGTTKSNRLIVDYKRKKLKKKQCSAGFICTITVEGGTAVPSVSLDRSCDASATTLQPGEEVLIFPDLGADVQSPFSCEHTLQYQGPAGSGLSLTCPDISLIKGCFKEVITVTDASGFSKKFFCDEDIEYSASGGSMTFSYSKISTGKKDCPAKFFCLVTVEECRDTWPGYCIDFPTPNGGLVGACSCSEVVWLGWCRDPAYADLAADCKLSCNLCDDLPTIPPTIDPTDSCVDTWPNPPVCFDYIDNGACSCQEVVGNNMCNDPCYNSVRSLCRKSCGLCGISLTASDECISGTTITTVRTKVPTTNPATTSRPTEKKVTASFKLTNKEYNEKLADTNSAEFISLKKEVEDLIEPTLKKSLGTKLSAYEVTGFKQGSVIVDSQVTTTDESESAAISSVTMALMDSGANGLDTSSVDVQVQPTNPPTTLKPTVQPTNPPSTLKPTVQPTNPPTTLKPTVQPTNPPTTLKPTVQPTNPSTTLKPTVQPTNPPTTLKTTVNPTVKPSDKPTVKPPVNPTDNPTVQSTVQPTVKPSVTPTAKPTEKPTLKPTENPNPSTDARPYCDNCGTSSISVARGVDGNRIVGGQQATKGEYPWQVYLGISRVGRCGGSLIKKSWILSAAHCFTGEYVGTISEIEIRLGAHDLQDLSDPNVQIIVFNQQDVANRVTTHPAYDEYKILNDIALIELKEDLVFTSRILPICLADINDFAAGKQGVATGWGILAHSGNTASEVLLEVGLETIDLATCQDLYQKTPNKYGITDTMICTLTTGKDTCSGDSGGPLVVQLDNGKWVQIGITSFGIGCANPKAPGVWTNVAKYKTWVDQITGSNQC